MYSHFHFGNNFYLERVSKRLFFILFNKSVDYYSGNEQKLLQKMSINVQLSSGTFYFCSKYDAFEEEDLNDAFYILFTRDGNFYTLEMSHEPTMIPKNENVFKIEENGTLKISDMLYRFYKLIEQYPQKSVEELFALTQSIRQL